MTLRQKSARRRKLWKRELGPQGKLIWARDDSYKEVEVPKEEGETGDVEEGLARSHDSFGDEAMLSTSPGYVSYMLEDSKDMLWKSASSPTHSGGARAAGSTSHNATGSGGTSTSSSSTSRTKKVGHSLEMQKDVQGAAALPFRAKQMWFLDKLSSIQVSWNEGHIRLEVNRTNLLEDSFTQMMSFHASEMRQWMRVQFVGEPGVDAGGLEREWFILISQEIFDPARGLFTQTGELQSYNINPASGRIASDVPDLHLQYFYFTGRVVGKALMEHQIIPGHLSLPLLKHILAVPITFSDLEFVDAELYKHLKWIKENDVSSLHLDFTVLQDHFGEQVSIELKKGGASIVLTEENKVEYLQLMLKYRMLDSIKDQLWYFLKGLYEVIPRELLCVFDYQELELIISGLPEIDVSDWKRHTEYLGQYARLGDRHPVIKWFWEVVNGFNEEEKARLLQFCTGTCRLPAQGFKALQSNDGNFRRFNIQSVRRQECIFPRAHTCFNKLDLPLYDSKEELEGYLTLVINMEITGFTMD